MEKKELIVWTNGNAIRKYQGQDKVLYPRESWFKAKAILIPIKEDSNDTD